MPTRGRPSSRAILHHPLVRPVLLGDLVVLDLEIDVFGAEDPHQRLGVVARLAVAFLDEALAEPGLQAARERHHAFGVALQEPQVDIGVAAVEALQEAGRGQRDQVLEAGPVAGEQRQVVALVLHAVACAVVVDHVGLEAHDRLHVVLAAGLVELHRPVHDAMVGEAEGRHAELCAARDQPLDLAGAVEQGILGVDVEVDCGGIAHSGPV